MSVFDQSIRQFLADAASSAPTPGGGSVAALAAALGAAMSAMVANVSKRRAPDDTVQTLDDLVARMNEAITSFERILNADSVAFDTYMNALRLPKQTAAEKAARTAALQAAMASATEVPIELAQACLDALKASRGSLPLATPFILSDLGLAVLLLETAGQSALLTAAGNLASLTDESIRVQVRERIDSLAQSLASTKAEMMNALRARMEL
ncbi:cyclodeaminase/cyclohydrolase family protein [Alicyclobacillus acidiphilus]|uniref:cyclodeaminase/cyclohydrolase family protein n=1 Tax=Alicyclobacillus acidiphilus TaxID=182455 RepID=UPI0008340856|nr:cyclodeaminase/cyclohydrolase family protein [Alicyclobacillus acidiphilus]